MVEGCYCLRRQKSPRGPPLKRIEDLIIQPHKLEDVKEALKGIGVDGMTITEVRGNNKCRKDSEERYPRAWNTRWTFCPGRVKLEMVVPDPRLEEVVRTLVSVRRGSGKIGDGKIFVYDVADAIRIRNWDDRGDAAL